MPGAAEFTIDARAPTAEAIAELERQVAEVAARSASEEGLELELEPTFTLEPLGSIRSSSPQIEGAAAGEGAASLRLPSGAGHDAMVIGRHVPAAMIFVPSAGGISHSPAERLRLTTSSLACGSWLATLERVLTAANSAAVWVPCVMQLGCARSDRFLIGTTHPRTIMSCSLRLARRPFALTGRSLFKSLGTICDQQRALGSVLRVGTELSRRVVRAAFAGRRVLAVLGAALVSALVSGVAPASSSSPHGTGAAQRLNVVFIVSDDERVRATR